MKRYQKEFPSLKHESPRYRKNQKKSWGDKLDFVLDDMENFWDDIYDRTSRASQPPSR